MLFARDIQIFRLGAVNATTETVFAFCMPYKNGVVSYGGENTKKFSRYNLDQISNDEISRKAMIVSRGFDKSAAFVANTTKWFSTEFPDLFGFTQCCGFSGDLRR